jgi:hypothetical protein
MIAIFASGPGGRKPGTETIRVDGGLRLPSR